MNKKRPLLDRFMDKVMPEPNTGCWLWIGAINRSGYGRFIVNGINKIASRVSYEIHKGDVGDLKVLHTCDVPACVNPDHLYKGTPLENSNDMIRRGRQRHPKGIKRNVKLNVKIVEEIRTSNQKASILAKKYKVNITTIYHIKTFTTWKQHHIDQIKYS